MESIGQDTSQKSHPAIPSKILNILLSGLQTAALSLLLFLAVGAFMGRVRIESISMEPTLYRGEFIVVNKLAALGGDFQRGSIVVFKYPPDPNLQYIKRIVGRPGEQVLITGGRVYIDGRMLSEPYIMADPNYIGIWHVPADAYFVLGDNRNRSNDSHVWGMVPRKNIVGKAELIYWPPEEAGFIQGTSQ